MRALACLVLIVAACGSPRDRAPPDLDAQLPDRSGLDAGPGDAGTLEASMVDPGPQTTCTIGVDATVSGTFKISVDDTFKLYVNGTLVQDFAGGWTIPQTDTVTLFRHPSKKNVIAIEAANVANAAGLDRVVVADLVFDAGSGEQHVVTDATWQRAPGGLETSWMTPDFAEAGWVPATVEGTHGDPPYGAILGTSTAKYIWSYDSGPIDVMAKPTAETVYFRKSFYLSLAGAVADAPEACD
jgi:hypothetical protein